MEIGFYLLLYFCAAPNSATRFVAVAGRMYAFRLSNALQLKAEFHWIGFALILVDFFVSGVPVRLLHFYQPLSFALLYNVALLIFTFVTRRQGPFYRVADYFSHDTDVSPVLALVSLKSQIPLRCPGRRQIRGWLPTCCTVADLLARC